MDKLLKKNLTEIAETAWGCGYAGSACIPVQFMRKISAEETKKLQDMFKPEIEKELTKLHAMKKNDLNRNYVISFMRIHTKLEGEKNPSEFTLEHACDFKIVRGRTIHTILPIDEILKEDATSYYYKKSSKGDWHGSESFKSLSLDSDGCYKRFIKDEIYQPPLEIARKRRNWGRVASRKQFVKLVLDYVDQKMVDGWKLVATDYQWCGSKKLRFDFERAA